MTKVNRFVCVTLFPEMFQAITDFGVTGRAVDRGLVEITTVNPRDYTLDKHRTVDDRPYGGGPGMLMMVEPLQKAIVAAKQQLSAGVGNEGSDSGDPDNDGSDNHSAHVVYLSPQGQPITHQVVKRLSRQTDLVLVAGRYEGVDERLITTQIDEELSLGDFVLSGGELAAMALMDSVIRTLPNVLGHDESAAKDSFAADGLLDHPHFTRPEVLAGLSVPKVLLSGNHAAIERWRLKQSLGRTWLRRPELLAGLKLTEQQQSLLEEFQAEHRQN